MFLTVFLSAMALPAYDNALDPRSSLRMPSLARTWHVIAFPLSATKFLRGT
jgi:hypothetical protein